MIKYKDKARKDYMSDYVNEDLSRGELNKLAKDAGLQGAETYKNKPLVAEAINKVRDGQDAAVVDAEYAQPANDDTKPAATPSTGPAASTDVKLPKAEVEQRKNIHAINGGHPRKFDETGNPVYGPEDV